MFKKISHRQKLIWAPIVLFLDGLFFYTAGVSLDLEGYVYMLWPLALFGLYFLVRGLRGKEIHESAKRDVEGKKGYEVVIVTVVAITLITGVLFYQAYFVASGFGGLGFLMMIPYAILIIAFVGYLIHRSRYSVTKDYVFIVFLIITTLLTLRVFIAVPQLILKPIQEQVYKDQLVESQNKLSSLELGSSYFDLESIPLSRSTDFRYRLGRTDYFVYTQSIIWRDLYYSYYRHEKNVSNLMYLSALEAVSALLECGTDVKILIDDSNQSTLLYIDNKLIQKEFDGESEFNNEFLSRDGQLIVICNKSYPIDNFRGLFHPESADVKFQYIGWSNYGKYSEEPDYVNWAKNNTYINNAWSNYIENSSQSE